MANDNERGGPTLEHALAYAASGRSVFPVKADKTPHTDHGFKDATTDEASIRGWWKRWPTAGIATPTGPDWFALDVDDSQALEVLEAEHGPLPPTVEVITPRPGRHIYLMGKVGNARGSLPDGIDCRGSGGYVLLPPSPHPNGAYEWRTALDEAPIAAAPTWLLELLSTAKRINGAAPAVEGDIPAHTRNSMLTSMAGTMRRRGFHESAIAVALLDTNENRCEPPLSESDVRKIAHSVARYKPAKDAGGSLTELTALLGLEDVGKRIDEVRIFGRGSRAHVTVLLDDGGRIVLDPLGACSTPAKLVLELASQAGATPTLKGPDVAQAVKLIYLLGDHHEAGEISDRAWELGAEYLRNAAIAEVAMDDQAERWSAFATLDKHNPAQTHIVLLDSRTGKRYVRTQWFMDHLRARTGPGEPQALTAALERLGWSKPGTEGRIKATQPAFKHRLQWAFLVVPPDWEHE